MTSTDCGKTVSEVVRCPSVTELDFAPPNHPEIASASFLAAPIRKSMSSPLSFGRSRNEARSLPRPKRSPGPRRGKTRQRPGLLLLRRLPLRLRSQHRPVTPHPRRSPRRCKTQNRPHRCLPRPNPPAGHPHLPGRIHQRLRHGRLAQIHPQFRQQQPRLPLPAQTRTQTAWIPPTSTVCLRPAIASTRRSNCGSFKCSGRASARLLASHPTRPTRPPPRPTPIETPSTLRKT